MLCSNRQALTPELQQPVISFVVKSWYFPPNAFSLDLGHLGLTLFSSHLMPLLSISPLFSSLSLCFLYTSTTQPSVINPLPLPPKVPPSYLLRAGHCQVLYAPPRAEDLPLLVLTVTLIQSDPEKPHSCGSLWKGMLNFRKLLSLQRSLRITQILHSRFRRVKDHPKGIQETLSLQILENSLTLPLHP